MTRPLVLRSVAASEFRETRRWYEERRSGLGEEFAACVEVALGQIRRRPEAYPRIHGNIRRLLTRRFPYAVFYMVEPERVVVLAVFHSSRDPATWQQRSR